MNQQSTSAYLENEVARLFHTISLRMSPDDVGRIRAAYELAAEAHQGQKRKSGEHYIIHPIAVARIVAEELELGANQVMAAFLHDVVEDTHYTLDEIRRLFGNDVAFLVNTLPKARLTA